MTSTTFGIVKTDTHGRRLLSNQDRQALLEAFDLSGMTGAAFARHHGVKYSTFIYWLNERKRGVAKSSSSQGQGFVEVNIEPAVTSQPNRLPSSHLNVQLPGGACVQVSSEQQLPLLTSLLGAL